MKKIIILSVFVLITFLTGCAKEEDFSQNGDNNVDTQYNKYEKGIAIYFNPETGLQCNDYKIENSKNENKTGCMKWYLLSEGTDTIDLILDHNTTAFLAWNNTGNGKGNLDGPSDEFLQKLKEDTKTWNGVPLRSDKYTVEQRYANYIIDYSGYRARFVTVSDITNVTGMDFDDNYLANGPDNFRLCDGRGLDRLNDDISEEEMKKYGWLFDNTENCLKFGCTEEDNSQFVYFDKYNREKENVIDGYWTATSSNNNVGDIRYVWGVNKYGLLNSYIYFNDEFVDAAYGLRPVITIPKNLVNY